MLPRRLIIFFFFNDPAPPEIYPLPLPDALPISPPGGAGSGSPGSTAAPTRCRSPRPGVPSARRSTSGSGSCSDATIVTDTSVGGVQQRSGEQDEKPQHEARGGRPAEPTPCGQRALAQGNLGT